MIAEFSLPILYSQVVVHRTDHPASGLLWSEDHVAQGFAWSEGQVAFGVPDHDGECLIRVMQSDDATLSENALWAVQVPFEVVEPLQIGTVTLLQRVDLPVGSYATVFEALPGDESYAFFLNLRFVATDAPDFAILKQGGEIETDVVLRRNADLAG